VPKISRCIEKMSESFGLSLALDGMEFFGFPTPAALARAGESALRKCELGFRAKYIEGIARQVAKGDFDPYSLAALPYDEAKKELMSLKGVGEKVADCVLLFSMDKLEAFPVDRWVKRVAERLFFNGKELSEKKVRLWGTEHYGRYAGYAQQYLFHYMRHREERAP
jgi:N-glycosylase/DNA lyase